MFRTRSRFVVAVSAAPLLNQFVPAFLVTDSAAVQRRYEPFIQMVTGSAPSLWKTGTPMRSPRTLSCCTAAGR